MVERTVFANVVGQGGGGYNRAVGGAKGGIIGAKALLPKAATPTLCQGWPLPGVAWCQRSPGAAVHNKHHSGHISSGQVPGTVGRLLVVGRCCCSNAVVHSTNSQQQCSLARDLPANTSEHAAIAWQDFLPTPLLPTLQLLLVPRPISMLPTSQRMSLPLCQCLVPG